MFLYLFCFVVVVAVAAAVAAVAAFFCDNNEWSYECLMNGDNSGISICLMNGDKNLELSIVLLLSWFLSFTDRARSLVLVVIVDCLFLIE